MMTDQQIIVLALQMILEFLEFSGYDSAVQWQMKLRINRMLANCHYDPNPEGAVLDYNIYKLGLTLLLKSDRSESVKSRARDVFQKRLGSGSENKSF